MEASDAAEHILELNEGDEGGEKDANEKFRSRAALFIAVMAMLLAITSLGGGNAAEDIMNYNIQASDTWAFYQAKTIRKTNTELAADALENQLMMAQNLGPEQRQAMEKKVAEYRQNVARYESEPDKGEGRKELSKKAQELTEQRDRAMKQDPNFDFAEALFQIAIVLASVAILATSRKILYVALVAGALAFVLMLNGYFLFFNLPF
jgi:glucose/arabinose dehydrogenase